MKLHYQVTQSLANSYFSRTTLFKVINKMACTIYRVKLHFFIKRSLPRTVSFTCFQNERNQMKRGNHHNIFKFSKVSCLLWFSFCKNAGFPSRRCCCWTSANIELISLRLPPTVEAWNQSQIKIFKLTI